MQTYACPNFCAGEIIGDLRDHKDARDAMISFCKLKRTVYSVGGLRLSAFYIFTGVEKAKNGEVKVGYGTNFAKFIKNNKLGKVVQSELRINRLVHPDHTDRVWIWMPSQENMQEWWTENNPEKTRKGFSY